MNAKSEQKERSHQTIIESAANLLRKRGISGARVADVMQDAGLTVGGFYAHFASKTALIDEAIRRTGRDMRERLFARIEDKPAADRADVILKRYLSQAHRDTGKLGCPFPAIVGEIGTAAPEHADALREQIESLTQELSRHLPEEETPALSRKQLALGLVALMYGGLSLARALGDSALSDELIRAGRALGARMIASARSEA